MYFMYIRALTANEFYELIFIRESELELEY